MIGRFTSRDAWRWTASLAALALLTVAMLLLRSRLDKAHIALLYLLVILGGSAVGGRALGLTIAALAFLSFNFLFLPPYYALTIANPVDWLVLVAFLVTGAVAAELLYRQQQQAALAERRAGEIDRLATLGAETLNAPRAEAALAAIADVIRMTIGVEQCELFVRDPIDGSLRLVVGGVRERGSESAEVGGLLQYIVAAERAAIERADATVHVVSDANNGMSMSPVSDIRAFAIPLAVRGETVGALRLSGGATWALTSEQLRILWALAYYAALGIERLRLEGAEDRAEALRRADHLKDALLASVSHDLRTPLTTIKAIAHEIVSGGDSERALVIEEEADRLASLVEGLLELSQLDAQALPLRVELNTVDDLVGAALQRAEAVLRSHPVRVNLADDALLVGRFDFVHSLRILVNLLDNAAKYSPPEAPIDLTARRDSDRILIVVSDRGRGIAPSESERVFEPFYRASGATPDVRGAGLGLAIAKRLAQVQGGDLTSIARPGGGTTFVVELPAGELPTD